MPDNNDPVLVLRGLSKVYPGTLALDNVDLEIHRGETHGIIGKNGAGKTTLVGIVAGLIRPTAGTVRISGHDYARLSRIGAREAGVAIVPQEPQLVGEATIAENLFMPDYGRFGHRVLVDWKRMYDSSDQILARSGLSVDSKAKAGDIGIGLQQILLMLKAAYVERAEIIILDEAFASLSEREEHIFYELIRERRDAGCTILHISHRIDELLTVCDRMTVLREGRSVSTVDRDTVDRNSLASLIVGEDTELRPEIRVSAGTNRGEAEGATPALEVNGFTLAERFHDVGFTVRSGEVVGVAGLIGSGRTSILKSIFGLLPRDSGTVSLDGALAEVKGPADALRHGIVYLPEERDEEGLVTSLSVKANLVLGALDRVTRHGVISKRAEQELAGTLAAQVALKFASFDQEVSELSGGNRQKVVVGKVLSAEPRVFLLDEPTKGIDIGAKAGLLKMIRGELSHSAAIVMTSPGIEDLMEVCDRVLALHEGRIVASFSPDEYEEERLYKAIQGNTGEGEETSP